jgi:polyphosphate kinase
VTAQTPPFINRELSWLAFNERVLEEAADATTPLLERVKFAAIAAANLDEFFMVRVAAVKRIIEEGDTAADFAGLTPSDQLSAIRRRSRAFVVQLYRVVTEDLLPALTSHRISILRVQQVNDAQRAALVAFFREGVLPVLTPLAIDVSRPFPLLSSLSLNLALLLEPGPDESTRRLAIVQVPSGLPRLVEVPWGGGAMYVLLEDVIRTQIAELFPGQTILETTVIRLARDAELELDDEGGLTHLEVVEREVRRRRRSDVVRLEVEASASEEILALLRAQLEISPEEVYPVPGPLDLRLLLGVTELPGFDALREPPLQQARVLADHEETDVFEVLNERDVLVHHPYDAYDPVIALIAQAADDPDVLAIKQTLYRTSGGSPNIAALQRAAERNKQVTVLVELTARFDEERNIQWARALEQAGAHVIYGVRRYKTHAKICLIVKRTPHGLRRYVHLGTGNYNERTARIYTDFALMTSSNAIAEDATAFFSALTGYSDPPRLKKLVMAPTHLRRRFLKLIDRERRRAEAGQPAEIVAKMNSLIDQAIIEALYAASQAGVSIKLNVRGICALRPAVPGLSETIEVISIVDRFLEHSRVYYFANGGDEQVYLASADWMSRNLDKRVELMFPVENPEHKGTVIYALRAMFRDNVKARCLRADGVYERKRGVAGEPTFRVQQHLQDAVRRRQALARERADVTFSPERADRPSGHREN